MSIKSSLPLLVIAIAHLCGGCANAYKQFYTANPASVADRLQPYSGKTEVFTSNDLEKDAQSLYQRGYLMLGHSSFEGGGTATEKQLREQATAVGADVVLTKTEYLGAEQRNVSLVQYHPGQTSTTTTTGNARANVYGSSGNSAYGNATYSGTSTTTTPGTYSTQVVPVTVHKHSWGATFWRKGTPPTLGVRAVALSTELRQKLQRNTGVLVETVGNDTPAFFANILPGDVIASIDDEPLSETTWRAELAKRAGGKVKLVIIRGSEEKVIEVKLNP